jgi:hypothetical protein
MRRRSRAVLLAWLATLLSVGMLAGVARADGDPGSDVLVCQDLFAGSSAGLSVQQQARLGDLLKAVSAARFPIRVALIASPTDLGAVTALWRKPRSYARFLGLELSLAYKQRLLVMMPNGFGFNWPGHSTRPTDEQRRTTTRKRPVTAAGRERRDRARRHRDRRGRSVSQRRARMSSPHGEQYTGAPTEIMPINRCGRLLPPGSAAVPISTINLDPEVRMLIAKIRTRNTTGYVNYALNCVRRLICDLTTVIPRTLSRTGLRT